MCNVVQDRDGLRVRFCRQKGVPVGGERQLGCCLRIELKRKSRSKGLERQGVDVRGRVGETN